LGLFDRSLEKLAYVRGKLLSLGHFMNHFMTRLGEFSPFGRLFTLDSFEKIKITEVEYTFGLLFSTVQGVH
jgi:hypothetical protein